LKFTILEKLNITEADSLKIRKTESISICIQLYKWEKLANNGLLDFSNIKE